MATTVVNVRTGQCDVVIGRAGPYGNPFIIGPDGDRAAVIEAHRVWVTTSNAPRRGKNPVWVREHVAELRDKRLGCFCHPLACHGDTLAAMADRT